MKFIKTLYADKYLLAIVAISFTVAILIHFPESIALFEQMQSDILFPDIHFWDVFTEIVFTFLSLLLLFAVNMALFKFGDLSISVSWKKLLTSFVLTGVLSSLLGKGFVFLHHTLGLPAITATVHHYMHPMRDLIMTSLVTGSCYMFHLIRRQQKVSIENQQLQAENIRNQYEALKHQLNPHMLFNSLNALRSLVREDQERAQEYILELSHVLRYTLQSNDSQSVRLCDEMEFASAYIFLLKMRYEDSIVFDINIHPHLDEFRLPPMAVQVLIENAVKHNEISSRRPLNICIETNEAGILKVSNRIQPKLTSTNGTGVGLMNLTRRYKLLFHQDITITEDSHFTVSLPLISESV